MNYATLLIFLVCAATTYARYEECVLSSSKYRIDLNGAASREGFYKATNTPSDWNYFINICAPANNFSTSAICTKVSANVNGYQVAPDGSQCYPMTNAGGSDIKLSLIDSVDPTKGVIMTYGPRVYQDYTRNVQITVYCGPQQTQLQYLSEDYTPGSSLYKLSMTSPYACISGGRPTTIYSTSGIFKVDLDPNSGRSETIYVDTVNHRLRHEYATKQGGLEQVQVYIRDYKNQQGYSIIIDMMEQSKWCQPEKLTEDLFNQDLFAVANYTGLTAFNGKIAEQWNNVLVPVGPSSFQLLTAYLDEFSGDFLGTSSGIARQSTQFFSFQEANVPDRMFTLSPELQKLCNK